MISIPKLRQTYTALMTGVIAMMAVSAHALTLDFSKATDLPRWAMVNDTVMGGRSRSTITPGADNHLFTGLVSLENNGGFASVRYRVAPALPEAPQISLRVKGDGQRYQLRFQMAGPFRPVSYAVTFQTIPDEWQTFTFLTEDFRPVWRGRAVQGAPALKTDQIELMSVYITDKQVGRFELTLDSVTFLADQQSLPKE